MKKIAILASYNGTVIDPIMKGINSNGLSASIDLIITNNTNANVLQKGLTYDIPSYTVNQKNFDDPDQKIMELLDQYNIDLVLLAGYMKKLPEILVDSFLVINSHPSLLPKYGGAGMYGSKVHEAVIKASEKESGVTVHKVTKNYDEGEILLQKSLFLDENETPQSLEIKVKKIEAVAVIETLQALCEKGN